MGKTYIDTIKYVIYAEYDVDGIVEKPDIVGAVFGQTEGLLGEGLDLRELQKSGRIGRIEVTTKNENGATKGIIEIPSSLDRIETSVLAAGLEAVDRVGPCEAHVTVTKIDDRRVNKRKAVVTRAQEILQKMISSRGPDSKEISETVRSKTKAADVVLYGPEKISAGPEAVTADKIIIVEGRADVISMLKAGIKNVISLHGKKIPKTVVGLARKKKEVTIFVDGDRGGELIVKQLADNIKIDAVAKAPDGKEVEELTQKEILKCLKKRMGYGEYMKYQSRGRNRTYTTTSKKSYSSQKPKPSSDRNTREPVKRIKKNNPYEKEVKSLEGSLNAQLIDKNGKKLKEIPVKDMRKEIEKNKSVEKVIFDGIITQGLIDLAQKNNVKELAGIKKGRVKEKGSVKVHTLY